jgi:seryl-tRNA synthetase
MKVTLAVDDLNPSPPSSESETDAFFGEMRSPIRPAKPAEERPHPAEPSAESETSPESVPAPDTPANPVSALNVLRQKMQTIADEFAEGKINRAQFNAMYKRYSEQRTIIERLVQRNPDSDAWRQVMGTKGYTSYLRSHFEAQPLYYAIHAHRQEKPIVMGGTKSAVATSLQPLLEAVWKMSNIPKAGVGRKSLANGEWLILVIGEYALTAVVFSLEPSIVQARLVRDLHNDFERANHAALARKWIIPDRMVFPQRALTEASL